MKIELYKLHQYLFGDWADLDKSGETKVEATTLVLSDAVKARNKAKKEQAIQELFSAINNKDKFRAALRAIKVPHPLELLLFKNVTDKLSGPYAIPDEKEIETAFDNLNGQYKFFSATSDKKSILKKFKELFLSCKMVGDFFECNNDDQNTVAALHAYKIIMLFGDFPSFQKYLNAFNYFKLDYPIHDALIYPIPDNTRPFHLEAWRKIILDAGPKAMQLLNRAPAIEAYLKHPPKNLAEAQDAATKIKYNLQHLNPELANLCGQYNLDENLFNKCLEIDKNRKTMDYLPPITIDGTEVGKPGYYLTKLAIDDPRAYVLGHITSCCQSIGGHGEQCVIDGVTLPHNGFYVLLKKRDLTDPKTPVDDKGHIEYSVVDIAGQGYAWVSNENNLVFDSWENKTPGRDDPVITVMLEKFAQKATEAKSDIVRVTIGLGGKTPQILKENKVDNPEQMLQGTQYNDSKQFT